MLPYSGSVCTPEVVHCRQVVAPQQLLVVVPLRHAVEGAVAPTLRPAVLPQPAMVVHRHVRQETPVNRIGLHRLRVMIGVRIGVLLGWVGLQR